MSAAISIAKAASVTGQVFAISPDGKVRPLHPGDPLFPGEKVVTARDAQVVVKLADGREISLERSESLQLDGDVAGNSSQDDSAVAAGSPGVRELTAALAANRPLDDLLDEEATAAGESGAASEGGHNFVQFQRIVESIGSSDSAYRFGAGDRYALAERQNG
ncbi:MAG TPA: retention module-containing protein, partial [Azonexus sp.]|nr:retention module-containing protein [Azonexus sp.]